MSGATSTIPYLSLTGVALQNAKIFAKNRPDDFGCIFMNLPGYTAIVTEDNFHIMECKSMEVELQPQNECYDSLPIVQGNDKLFLHPWTRIITEKANEIPCDAPILENYQLDGMTYKVTPRPESPLVPQRQKYNIKLTWKYEEPANLWNSGIYKEDKLNEAWEKYKNRGRPDPPPPHIYLYPDSNGNIPGVTYPNRPGVPWYKSLKVKDTIVIVVVAIIVIVLLVCIVKMVVDRVKHGSAFHSINRCRRGSQTSSIQTDLTIKLNKSLDV